MEQDLILFVTLNVNKNTEPVRALGKMLLQNLRLVVGKRSESEEQRRRTNRPMFGVVLDGLRLSAAATSRKPCRPPAARTQRFCSPCKACHNSCRSAEDSRRM